MKLFLVYSTLDTTIKVFSPINLQSSKASMKGHVLGTQPTARKRRGLQLRKPNVEFAYLILNCVISFCLCIFQTHKISAATTYILLTKGKETHPIMLQRNCIFSTFKFIVATGKEFVPLVPAKSGSKCIAMEIFSESSKMLYLYFAHSSFFSRQTSSKRGYGMKVL